MFLKECMVADWEAKFANAIKLFEGSKQKNMGRFSCKNWQPTVQEPMKIFKYQQLIRQSDCLLEDKVKPF